MIISQLLLIGVAMLVKWLQFKINLYNMIQQEIITVNDRELRRTYSDNNKYIKQVETGIEYADAVDIPTATFTYEETDNELDDYSDINSTITMNE